MVKKVRQTMCLQKQNGILVVSWEQPPTNRDVTLILLLTLKIMECRFRSREARLSLKKTLRSTHILAVA